MATVSFLIRNPEKNKRSAIHYYVSIARDKRIRGTTDLKIDPKFWDSKSQLVRNRVEVYDIKDSINKKLKNLESFIYKKLNDYKTEDFNSLVRFLKADIDEFLGKNIQVKESLNLVKFYEWYVEHYKTF